MQLHLVPLNRRPGIREIRERRKASAEIKQASTKERREREKDLGKWEATILKLETKQKELAGNSSIPSTTTTPASRLHSTASFRR